MIVNSVRARLTAIVLIALAVACGVLALALFHWQTGLLAPGPEAAALRWRAAAGTFGLAVLVFLVAGALMTWALQEAMRPLEGLLAGAAAITGGDLDQRLPEGADDWGRVGGALNLLASKLAEQIHRQEENQDRLSTVIAHMASGVLLVDGSGRLALANRAAQALTGLDEAEIGRNHVAALRHYDLSSAITHALSAGEEVRLGLSLQMRAAEAVLAPVHGRGVVVVLYDVTERERVDRMRRDFVANVSHELKTPVTAIQGFAETLLAGALEEPEARRQFVAIIHKESLRMSSLIADLLILAKLESEPGAIRPVLMAVAPLVSGVVERMRPQAEGRDVVLAVEAEPLEAEVDPARMEQVLINLIDNGIKHTAPGGRVMVRFHADGDRLVGQVEDSGIGIPPESLPRIFERFYRVDPGRARKAGGTGLGLSIVKHIVEAHGGEVAATSLLGKGTTITFSQPLRHG